MLLDETDVEDVTPDKPHTYWQAQGIAEITLRRFTMATELGDHSAQRRAYFELAGYYGRTRRIVWSALASGKEPLVQAALRNLVAMHLPLTQMHRTAPDAVPMALILDRRTREELARDLVVRVLGESPEPLQERTVLERVNELGILGTLPAAAVRRHLVDLTATGHAARSDAGFARSSRTYTETDFDSASLLALCGPELHKRLAEGGFRGLSDLDERQADFREWFSSSTSLGPDTAALIIQAAATLLDTRPPEPSSWGHADLLNSPYPRPYQYEAYAVFRGGGYQGQLVESPTGSGKTMIGMLCIQDWLHTLHEGQSILVLVPTASYEQQWIGELCFSPIGLRLPPELVFSGTPDQLDHFQRRTGSHPAVILMTYAALAQTGSGVGKGGFDVDSIEMFLQEADVQHVVLDEVHKVVEDMRSVSADVTRELVAWLRDGSIRGLIGFSGTAEAYRSRFDTLDLPLAHSIPLNTLIGYGFVAPFVELGVPFSNSARERSIRDLLDTFKAHVLEYLDLLGPERLRSWFAAIPLEDRVTIARDHLRMYHGRGNADEAIVRRLTAWEQGGSLGIAEIGIVLILQIAHGWPDAEMSRQAGIDPQRFEAIRLSLESVRRDLAKLIYLPSTVERLGAEGFATTLDRDAVLAVPSEAGSATSRAQHITDLLATTIVGLYDGLTDWYLRTGEGRVETIKALIDAERAVRSVTGIIVFDTGKRISWRSGLTAPGYDGVAGLFAQLLGDTRFTAVAALSSEMYLTYDERDPLPPRIARFVEEELMRAEIAAAIFGLATQGLDLAPDLVEALRDEFNVLVDAYVATLSGVHSPRLGEFRRRILTPFRRAALKLVHGPASERLGARLNLHNVHLADLIVTFFDYAGIAENFRSAHVGEVEQVSGARERFFVVPMPGGRRKQLMYDLTARIVDAERLPVNLIIVSSWARTGWNVIKPNVLIDATATRDVTAWQQLRGRAMRAPRTWTNDCYRLLAALRGGGSLDADVARHLVEALPPGGPARSLPSAVRGRLSDSGVVGLTDTERASLAIDLMLEYNKVTHVYELVKASGSTRQVEYDRQSRTWRRRQAIARKHAYETSVDIFSGNVAQGAEHAPLLYASDPRSDLPAHLEARVRDVIRDRDAMVVAGWFANSGN